MKNTLLLTAILIPAAAFFARHSMQQTKRTTHPATQMEASPDGSKQWFAVKTRASETKGKYAEVEEYWRIGGCGTGRNGSCVPPLHTHPNQDETFTILKGHFRYTCAGKEGAAFPGDTVTVPRGANHTWWTPANATEDVHVSIRLEPADGTELFFTNLAGVQRDNAANPVQMIWLLCAADSSMDEIPSFIWPHVCSFVKLVGPALGMKESYDEYTRVI